MQKTWLVLVCSLLAFAAPMSGALRYEYRESLTAENRLKSTNLTARAVIDSERGRIDILAGNRYEPGSYILADAGDRMYVVYPDRKQYTEIPIPKGTDDSVAQRLTIANPKIEFADLGDGDVIAGYPTHHYRLHATYEMTYMMGTIALKQKVDAVIEKWTTTTFDYVVSKYVSDNAEVYTGKADIDALLEAEVTKFKGLPLRQRTVITTTPQMKNQGSKLDLPKTRQRVREMEVTSIEEVAVNPNLFSIPAGFNKADNLAPAASAHYLTMEPQGQ